MRTLGTTGEENYRQKNIEESNKTKIAILNYRQTAEVEAMIIQNAVSGELQRKGFNITGPATVYHGPSLVDRNGELFWKTGGNTYSVDTKSFYEKNFNLK